MKVTVLLFGPEAAAAGRDRVEVEVDPACATCRGVRAALALACPALAPALAAARLAVNAEFARDDDPIRPGDEVALIGLVSGG